MHLSPWLVYIWGQADDIREYLSGAMVAGIVAAIVSMVVYIICWVNRVDNSDLKKVRNIFFGAISLLTMFFVGSTLMPSSKTVAMMAIVPTIANSKPIQTDLPEIYNMAIAALKEKLAVDTKSATTTPAATPAPEKK